jgi:hypothetical protein
LLSFLVYSGLSLFHLPSSIIYHPTTVLESILEKPSFTAMPKQSKVKKTGVGEKQKSIVKKKKVVSKPKKTQQRRIYQSLLPIQRKHTL